MGRFRQLLVLAAAGLAAVLLCGCVELDIDAGIDRQHNAWLRYSLRVDLAGFEQGQGAEIQAGLKDLARYYQDSLGFEVEASYPDGSCHLEMAKTIPCDDPSQAIEALRGLLTDEQATPFMRVEMADTSTDHQQTFLINAEIDMAKAAALTSADELAPGLRQAFDAGLLNSKGSVTLSLPASEIERGDAATLSGGLASLKTEFDFTTPQTLELATRVNTGAAILAGDDPQGAAGRLRGLAQGTFALAACAALAVLAGIVLLVALRRRDGR